MANVKISELPQVASVLGTDIVPTVASSATSKITVTDLANSLPQVSSSISASYSGTSLSASYATTASFAVSASWAPAGVSIDTSSFITTGSNGSVQSITGSLIVNSSLIITGSILSTGSFTHIGTVNATNLISLNNIQGPQIMPTVYDYIFENFDPNYYNKAAFPFLSDSNTGGGSAGAGSYEYYYHDAGLGHTVYRTSDGQRPAPAIKLTRNQLASFANLFNAGQFPYYTIITDNYCLTDSQAIYTYAFANGRYHTLTVTGSILSKDGVTLGTNITNNHYVTGSVFSTGSITQNGSLTVTNGGITGSLFGTSSWAISASWAPSTGGTQVIAATGSTLYSTTPAAGVPRGTSTQRSIFFGSASAAGTNNIQDSIFLGAETGYSSSANYSTFIGTDAGYKAGGWGNNYIGYFAGFQAAVSPGETTEFSNFIGYYAGFSASFAPYSNFIGNQAGYEANNAYNSNFIGESAGYGATLARNSNFIGPAAGIGAVSASFSILLGHRAGYKATGDGIGRNNIIIGTSITLENNRVDSINIGGIIFGTGSYYSAAGGTTALSSGSANGRIGINVVNPTQALEVSGSVQISQVLVLPPQSVLPSGVPTGSIASSGSGVDCKPYFWNGSTWTSLI